MGAPDWYVEAKNVVPWEAQTGMFRLNFFFDEWPSRHVKAICYLQSYLSKKYLLFN